MLTMTQDRVKDKKEPQRKKERKNSVGSQGGKDPM